MVVGLLHNMPEIPLEVLQQRGTLLGSGFEKKVFDINSSDNPDRKRALAVYHEEQDSPPELVKGRYYLTKIFELLFPEHTIKMYAAHAQPDLLVMDKVNLVGAHKEIKELFEKGVLNGPEYVRVDKDLEKIIKDSGILLKFSNAGVEVDTFIDNFGETHTGDVKYCDTFEPWCFRNGKINFFYDSDKLRGFIENKLFGFDREEALNYLKRLNHLAEMAQQKNNTKAN